tara:strand:- start:2690 stop:3280 length:591 start_codon:yes stop_codon:yes gene_type:complete
MFENQNRYQANLSLALLDLLKNNKLEKIHSKMIIKKCKTKIPDGFIWLAENKVNLLKYYFQSSNNVILSNAAIDFKEDNSATINEKLTDIIIRNIEFHHKFKKSIINIYKLKFSNYKIFQLFFFYLKDLSSKSLNISGGLQHNYKDELVLLGIISTYTLIFDKWISCNDEDFSSVMKVADEYLNNAEEVGLNFRVI